MGLMLHHTCSYALGTSFAWMGLNRWCIAAVTVTVAAGLITVSILGLHTGTWVQNAAAIFHIATFAALIFFPLTGRARDYTPLHIAVPAI